MLKKIMGNLFFFFFGSNSTFEKCLLNNIVQREAQYCALLA